MHACIGEGNGNPLQCSSLGNPRDGGAWWAAVYGSHRVGHDWRDLAELFIYFVQPVNISSFSLLTSLAPIRAEVGVLCLGPIFYLYYAWIPSCLPKDLFILSYRLYFCLITRFLKYIYTYFLKFIWLYWILVTAFGIFSCGMWDLDPWSGMKPRLIALGAWSLSHWTTREVHPSQLFHQHLCMLKSLLT